MMGMCVRDPGWRTTGSRMARSAFRRLKAVGHHWASGLADISSSATNFHHYGCVPAQSGFRGSADDDGDEQVSQTRDCAFQRFRPLLVKSAIRSNRGIGSLSRTRRRQRAVTSSRGSPSWKRSLRSNTRTMTRSGSGKPGSSRTRQGDVPTLSIAAGGQEAFTTGHHLSVPRGSTTRTTSNYSSSAHGNHGELEGRAVAARPIQFGSATATGVSSLDPAPWFAIGLKGIGKLSLPEATLFEGDGTNTGSKRDRAMKIGCDGQALLPARDHGLLVRCAPRRRRVPDGIRLGPGRSGAYRERPIKPTKAPGTTRWSRWLSDRSRFLKGSVGRREWQTAHC
jgi:hypothetical protein